jgi:hypothetical protein
LENSAEAKKTSARTVRIFIGFTILESINKPVSQ